jgi:GxxExxY protein
MIHEELTKRIIGAYYNVYNALGYGFLEKVYQNALLLEMRSIGLQCTPQSAITVFYNQEIVGEYFADIVVENTVICELKAIEALREEHEAQLLNYLKATPIEVGLLLNFGVKPTFRRKIFTNDLKPNLKKTL